jgi:hypothetical protein
MVGVSATPLVDIEGSGGNEQHDQRQQLRHLEPDVGNDLGVDPPAQFDGVHQGAEIVVGQDHAGRLFGDLAAAAHRDANVGLLQSRGIVDRVAGHRDDQPLALHDPGQAKLFLRGDAAEDVQFGETAFQFLVGHRPQLAAADRSRTEPKRFTDRLGGHRMVAGDHADVDPGVHSGLHGRLCLGPKRVDDAHHADEGQLMRQ